MTLSKNNTLNLMAQNLMNILKIYSIYLHLLGCDGVTTFLRLENFLRRRGHLIGSEVWK